MNPPLEIFRSAAFERWLRDLRDLQARTRVVARAYGPGYRVYFMRRGFDAVVLLCGGDKRTQAADIERAKGLAEDWRG